MENAWLIKSYKRGEHWWGPDQRGYFTDVLRAGIYTEECARNIVAFHGSHLEAVPLVDVFDPPIPGSVGALLVEADNA